MTAGGRPAVRWGILGTARIAARVCAAMRVADGAVAAAVASRDAGRARRWAAEHGTERSYGSYRELLDDGEIDAVYLPLPPALHAEWTVRAAEAGKHVLCEKPLAASVAEAERMVAACRASGVQLMDGMMWKHHPRTAMMRRHLERGELGEPRRVTAAFTLSWEPLPEDDIRFQRELGGGVLGDLGWYCVAAALWAFGELPERAWATARWFREVDANLSGFLWFPGERVASFDCGFDTVARRWFEIAGTRGSIVCDDFVRPQRLDKARYWLHDADGNGREHLAPPVVQEVAMIERFSALVADGELDERWPAEAAAIQRVCDALLEAARRGEAVAV